MSETVSVIVTAYNVERYLSKCLDSILAQTYPELEVIVIDDASTDKTKLICDEYKKKDQRVRVIHLAKNGGVSNARNVAIENAKGTYLTFIDGDDWINTAYVEEYLTQAKKHNAEIVMGPYFRFNDQNGMFYFYDALYPTQELTIDDYIRERALQRVAWFSNLGGKLYHRRLFEHKIYGTDYFPVGWFSSEDQIVSSRLCFLAHRIWYTQEANYCWRIRKGSVTQTATTSKTAMDALRAEMQYLVDLAMLGKLDQHLIDVFKENIASIKSQLNDQSLQTTDVYQRICQQLVL